MSDSGDGPTGTNHNPAPGWYPDPGSPSLRWWDGNRWSDTVVPIPETPSSQSAQRPPQMPTITPRIPSSSPPQSTRTASAGEPSPAAMLLRRHWRRLLLDTVLLVLSTVCLVATFANFGRVLGGSFETADFVLIAILLLLAVGAAYCLWRRTQFYVHRHPDGEASGTKLRDGIMGVWFVGAVVLAVVLGIDAARGPSLSGSDLQTMLRSNLAAAEGSDARTNTIACSTDQKFSDGDVARCTVRTYGDTVEILMVTVFRESDEWRLAIDVE